MDPPVFIVAGTSRRSAGDARRAGERGEEGRETEAEAGGKSSD